MTQDLHSLRYPIGEFAWPETNTADQVSGWINDIASIPARVRAVVEPLTPAQLATPYRPDGWSVLQVVHHMGDSNLNGMIRFKLALTEDRPTIRPYEESEWAKLADYREVPASVGLDFLDSLHTRWVVLLRSLHPADWKREFLHPDWPNPLTVGGNIALYAWHGNHHLAHITGLSEREGW